MNKDLLREYLDVNCFGKKQATPSRTLERALDLSGNEIRKQVNTLRREAVPIGSSTEGYFYAETAAEIYTTIRHLEKLRRGLDASIAGLEKAMEKFGDLS